MTFLKKLSGRTKSALRVFLLASVSTLLFVLTPVYHSTELEFYDVRTTYWSNQATDDRLPFVIFPKLDSTRRAGFDDKRLLAFLEGLNRGGIVQTYILGPSVLEDPKLFKASLPPNVVLLDPENSKDRSLLFQDAESLSNLLDEDGNLRRIPWDHESLDFAREIQNKVSAEPMTPRGKTFRILPLQTLKSSTGGQRAVIAVPLESAETFLRDSPEVYKDKIAIVELGLTAAASEAEIIISSGKATAGQTQGSIVRAMSLGWTVAEPSLAVTSVLFVLLVGGLAFFLSGRAPKVVVVSSLFFLVAGCLLSFQLLPLGFDGPLVALAFGMVSCSFFSVLFEIGRSRSLLKSFGGAEDARFEGEESDASMVFSNLPNFLLDMERNHDEDLLKFRRQYNEVLAEVAERYHGKVLDFQGDAQMVGFGLRYDSDTEHAAEATSAALEIVERVGALAAAWNVEDSKLRVHAGVCTGSIALGHLGAEQKQDIAAIGDTTNTAARLMGAAMKAKLPVLVAKSTFLLADGLIKGEELPPVELKGKAAPVEVFRADSVDPVWQELNRAKDKDLVPSGGTLVSKGAGQSFLVLSSVFGFVGLMLMSFIWRSGVLDEAELKLFDFVHQAVELRDGDSNIVIVGIDDVSRKDPSIEPFPWRRSVYAQAVENLKHTGYRGAFIDVFFKKARAGDPEGDQLFAAAVEGDPRVILAGVLSENEAARMEAPSLFPAVDYELLAERRQIGLAHNLIDDDGMTRLGFLTAQEDASHDSKDAHLRRTFPSGAAALMIRENNILEVGEGHLRLGERVVRAHKNLSGRTAVRIRFGPAATAKDKPAEDGSYQHISFNRLLDPSDPIFSQLDGKFLMIGQTMTDEGYTDIDRVSTIVGELKGVEVHARILDSLLKDDYFRRIRSVPRLTVVALVAILTQLILTFYREPKSYLKRLLVLVILLAGVYLFSLIVFSWLLDLLVLWLTVLSVTICVLLGRYALTFKALTRVIPAEIARELLFHHGSKDRRQVATILLTDIRGYTTLSEGRTAVAMLDVLNEYHKRTVACYDRFGGQALTYQGDAQIVIFGVFGNRPNPAADGAAAALELQSICDELRQEWGIESRDDFDVGAGLCTGEVEVGLLGGGANLQYSVVGETVRKAHKVQSLSGDLEAPVLLDEETFAATMGAVEVDDLGLVQPKGLPHEIRLYRAKSVKT